MILLRWLKHGSEILRKSNYVEEILFGVWYLVLVGLQVKAKFHYASWFVCLELVQSWLRTGLELVRSWFEAEIRPII